MPRSAKTSVEKCKIPVVRTRIWRGAKSAQEGRRLRVKVIVLRRGGGHREIC